MTARGEAADYAYRAIVEAIRLGLPIYVKRLVRGAFLLRRPNGGKGVVFSGWVPGESDDYDYAALGVEPVTIWKNKVAKVLRDGTVVEMYPFNVARTASHYSSLFSTHEADVWYRRLLSFWQHHCQEIEEYPSIVRSVVNKAAQRFGCRPRVAYFPEQGDYAVMCGDNVVAWINIYTGHVDDCEEFLRAAGLIG